MGGMERDYEKIGFAVTLAATLLARLSRQQTLDDRDRSDCQLVRDKLEEAERVMYPQLIADPLSESRSRVVASLREDREP